MRLSATLFIFGLASITGAAPRPMDTARAYANALDTADAERRIPSLVVPSIHTRSKSLEVYYRKDTDVRTATEDEVAQSEIALKNFLGHERARQKLGISDIEIEVKGEFHGFLQYAAGVGHTQLASHTRRVSFTFGAESPSPCHPLCAGLLDIDNLMGTIRDSEDKVIYTTNPKLKGLFYCFILVT